VVKAHTQVIWVLQPRLAQDILIRSPDPGLGLAATPNPRVLGLSATPCLTTLVLAATPDSKLLSLPL